MSALDAKSVRKTSVDCSEREKKQRQKAHKSVVKNELEFPRAYYVSNSGSMEIEKSRLNNTYSENQGDFEREFQDNKGTLSDWLNPKHPYFREVFKANWKTAYTKSQRKKFIQLDKNRINATHIHTVDFPFQVNSDDHCETSPKAYADISVVLQLLCCLKRITKEQLKIYDPYYCNGAVIQHLAELGYQNVYNRCEDFYDMIKEGKVPEHDVLVTNPPYSEYHLEKLLEFSNTNERPCLLLMPSFVVGKSFFKHLKGYQYICPRKRYVYWTPKGLRGKEKKQNHSSSLGMRTSPFPSIWYINLFQYSDSVDLVEQCSGLCEQIVVARNDSEIPRSMLE